MINYRISIIKIRYVILTNFKNIFIYNNYYLFKTNLFF